MFAWNREISWMACRAAMIIACSAGSALADATSFEEPALWSVGDAYTTSQAWGSFADAGDASPYTPDVGPSVNPAIGATPTLAVSPPAFVAGSGNFYSFSADYGIDATVYNHGGSGGVGGLAPGLGTYVIVQVAATLNDDEEAGGPASVLPGTVKVVDPDGNALPGGDNASALRHDVLFEGVVSSSFGEVTQREEVWEFFLPDYVGDFRVQAGVIVHSSFDELRIDSAVRAIPEPASLALLGAGGLLTVLRRKR